MKTTKITVPATYKTYLQGAVEGLFFRLRGLSFLLVFTLFLGCIAYLAYETWQQRAIYTGTFLILFILIKIFLSPLVGVRSAKKFKAKEIELHINKEKIEIQLGTFQMSYKKDSIVSLHPSNNYLKIKFGSFTQANAYTHLKKEEMKKILKEHGYQKLIKS